MTRLWTLLLPLLVLLSTAAIAAPAGRSVPRDRVFHVVNVDADDRLNVRAEAAVSSAIVGTLSPDEQNVVATGVTQQNGRTRWRQIRHGRRVGWVSDGFLARSHPDEPDAGNGRDSPFTRSLLAAMSEPEVEVREMFAHARDAVARQTEGRQVPWIRETVVGEYYFRPAP